MKAAFSLGRAGPVFALACEAIGLLALWLAPDVERGLFLAPALTGTLALAAGFRLRDRFLLPLLAALVVAGYALAGAEPTGTLLARAILPAHALLWLADDEPLYRYWRTGLGLIELVLAAILAPEAYMFVLIFLFVVLSSVSLSVAFLERNYRLRDPESLRRPLRASFVGAVLAVSFVIFLSSLVIFPILPRSRWGGTGGGTTTGYADSVSLRQSILYWTSQDSRPVAWIFRQEGQEWERVLPYFLLRGQVLEEFSNDVWRAVPRLPSAAKPAGRETVEILRQPLPADVLPVPYGAGGLAGESDLGAARYEGGEWLAGGSRSRRVRYRVEVDSFRPGALGPAPASASSPAYRFPAKLLPGMAELAARLSAGAGSDDEKLTRLREYFRDSGLSYELGAVEAAEKGRVHPLERFLFETKKGHCELFASSMALLARAMGLPSRLVVGFRLRPPAGGEVLTVHSTDAHAWLEVYARGRGWVPLDPTPVVEESGWLRGFVGDAYDRLNAYWALYILEYEFDFELSLGWLSPLAGALGAAILLAGLWLLWVRSRHRESPRETLARMRLQLEDDLVHKAGVYADTAYRNIPEAKEWLRLYTELRFGRGEPTPDELRFMRREAAYVVATASPARAAGG